MDKILGKEHLQNVLRFFTWSVFIVVLYALGFSSFYAVKAFQFLHATQHTLSVQNTAHIATSLPNQTNILLMGSDNDQKFTGNPLTQTMMIVHIDAQKKEVDLFSIPRDLWVNMPDTPTYAKIDEAAGFRGLPYAIETVERTFGIHIDHYAWVGLSGFIKSIDAVGGINLDALHPIVDNAYPTDINNPDPYGIQRLNIRPGMQHFTGEEALQYVRSRHEDVLGDVGRTERQRQLLLSLKQQLSSFNTVQHVPVLFDTLKDQIKTDMTASYGIRVGYWYATNQPITEKQFAIAIPTYAHLGYSTSKQSIVVADPQLTAQLVGSVFGDEAAKTTESNLSNIKNVAPSPLPSASNGTKP